MRGRAILHALLCFLRIPLLHAKLRAPLWQSYGISFKDQVKQEQVTWALWASAQQIRMQSIDSSLTLHKLYLSGENQLHFMLIKHKDPSHTTSHAKKHTLKRVLQIQTFFLGTYWGIKKGGYEEWGYRRVPIPKTFCTENPYQFPI